MLKMIRILVITVMIGMIEIEIYDHCGFLVGESADGGRLNGKKQRYWMMMNCGMVDKTV
jgi:hypothetical protein